MVERERQADAPHVLVGAGVRQVVAVAQDRLYLRLRAVAVGGHARIEKKGVQLYAPTTCHNKKPEAGSLRLEEGKGGLDDYPSSCDNLASPARAR